MKNIKTWHKSVLLILTILILDQTFKFWVKTTMTLGQDIPVLGNWFVLHFIENNGMAFGMEMGGQFGKMLLSIFRILAVFGIGWYLFWLQRHRAPLGFILAISTIMAGAVGNIIDSAFYGMIFSESYYQPATLFPEGGGYSSFLHGRVVDMLYFPVIRGTWPEWSPIRGGEDFLFFRPVFNLADTAITTGVFWILIFQKRFFKEDFTKKKDQ